MMQTEGMEELEECSFLASCYPPVPLFDESDEFVARKLAEIEREVDKLSYEVQEAYYLAIEQEIKQRTNYVRSKTFLLMFLRNENFDASKAALRMANFFKWKLHLFGPNKLPHPICQDDLNEDDKRILHVEAFHYSGVDCEGRPVLTVQLAPINAAGFYHQRYLDNFNRIGFYVRMCIIEGNEICQKKGLVSVRWGLEHKMSLKDFRILSSAVKMLTEAIPLKLVAAHDCRFNALSSSWLAFIQSLMPKSWQDKNILHLGDSPSGCLASLSQYGINIDCLPSNISGNTDETIERQLERLQQNNLAEISIDKVGVEKDSLRVCTPYTDPNLKDFEEDLTKSGNEKKSTEFDIFSLDLLEILKQNKVPHAICWSRGGTAIFIYKREFSNDVLPKEFGGIKFDSFVRKLSRCGFKRLTNIGMMDLNCMEYEHPLFRKDSQHLLRNWQLREEQRLKKGKFPVKLMKALQNETMSHAIWWVCNGNAIAIEKNRIQHDVLDRYFEGLKLDSFYRMLGKWDFHRLHDEENCENIIIFQNAMFKKEMPLWVLGSLKQKTATPQPNFFEKLYQILSSRQAHGAIWWCDEGDAFSIHTINFARDVLPQEYSGIKFQSFRRSLKRWGFKQLQSQGNTLVFHHPKFQREILRQGTK